jgi:hypothetical protein
MPPLLDHWVGTHIALHPRLAVTMKSMATGSHTRCLIVTRSSNMANPKRQRSVIVGRAAAHLLAPGCHPPRRPKNDGIAPLRVPKVGLRRKTKKRRPRERGAASAATEASSYQRTRTGSNAMVTEIAGCSAESPSTTVQIVRWCSVWSRMMSLIPSGSGTETLSIKGGSTGLTWGAEAFTSEGGIAVTPGPRGGGAAIGGPTFAIGAGQASRDALESVPSVPVPRLPRELDDAAISVSTAHSVNGVA